ncbi:MAG: DNA repair protein RecN [Muribaculaceae bacterium]|nr:DNA repair protein RecN [Muribaculaceae bacterium]
MLDRLTITNYALIEHLEFVPGEGLSIITGETGAGKSVMLGALALLKGERADLKVIADKSRKAVVEASFRSLDPATRSRIQADDPEWDGDELILRREILPSGRSRGFINDSPATIGQLEEATRGLLDIHSQNSNTLLSEPRTQLALIDSVARNEELLAEYTEEFRNYVTIRQRITRLREEAARNREQAEIIAYRFGQLDKLRPKAGELKRIENRFETLSNSEDLRDSLVKALRALGGSDSNGALEQIEDARTALADVDFTIWEEQDPEVLERLRQCVVEIKDIVETIEDAVGMTECDPSTLAALSQRMNAYYAALKAFRVETDEELERLYAQVRAQYESIENGDSGTEELERDARKSAAVLKGLAADLSGRRREAAASLQKDIEEEARKLGLSNLRFEIGISDAKLSRSGGDAVEFRAAFNKNAVPAPVGDMASGGEMARLMLAIKKITASYLSLPTIIFDEIDTGVSGHIADRMGEMMMEMGKRMQILTITHLPQVAVKGARHFKVYKEDRDDRTVSDVMLLTESQREEEIGRMLAGEVVDDAALSNARSLLKKKS